MHQKPFDAPHMGAAEPGAGAPDLMTQHTETACGPDSECILFQVSNHSTFPCCCSDFSACANLWCGHVEHWPGLIVAFDFSDLFR